MGIIGAGITAKGEQQELDEAKDQFARVEQDRERALALGDKLKWSPEKVSAALGSYQRSQSPVADAFLGSFLSGNNDQAIQSTRAGAPRLQQQARQSFDQQYGGWDKLRQQDAEMRKSQPWMIKDIGEVEKVDASKGAFEASEAGYLDKDQLSALQEQGLKFKGGKPAGNTKDQIKFWTGLDDVTTRGGKGQQFLQALSSYLQQGGSWKELTIDKPGRKKNYKIDVDAFIDQYRPQGAVSLAKPAPGRAV